MAEVDVQAAFGQDVARVHFSNGYISAFEARDADGACRVYRAVKEVSALFGRETSLQIESSVVCLSLPLREDNSLLKRIIGALHRHYGWPPMVMSD